MINGEDDYSYMVENGNGIFFDDAGFEDFDDFLEESNSRSAAFNYPSVDIPHLDYLTTDDLPLEASTSFFKKVKNNAFQGQSSFEDGNHFDDADISSKRVRFADGEFIQIPNVVINRFLGMGKHISESHLLQNPLAEGAGVDEDQPSPELPNGVDKNQWTFEEDFTVVMCGIFYKDPGIAVRAIDRSESEIEERFAFLQTSGKFTFDEKLYMLPRSQYLYYLRKVPIEESDLSTIQSLSSAHVPTTKEISRLRKSLKLPLDTRAILWFWKSFKQEHLLMDQVFERLNLRRRVEYVLDDVEKKADSDFLRNHRYLYNAIPGETSFMKTFQKNPLLELSLSNAVCSVIFKDSGKILPLKTNRNVLSFSEEVELIPLIKKYNTYYPLKPYSTAVLIFWKNTDLFLVNLCLHSILVGFNLVKPRYYIKLNTDRYTPIDINPTLDTSNHFYIAPNSYYFSTGRDVRLVPLPGKMKFSFASEWPSRSPRNPGEQTSTDLHIKAYSDAVKFMRRNKLPQITDDDFEFLNEVKSRQFKAREHVRDHPGSGEKLITDDFQNKKIQDSSSSQEGHDSQIPKARIDEKFLRSNLQIINTENLEKPTNPFTTKDIEKLRLNIGLKQYEILQPTGCDVADVLYSSIFARYKQKSTLKKSAKKLDMDSNVHAPALPAKVISKPNFQKQPKKIPLKRKIEPVRPVQVDSQMPNLDDSYFGDSDPYPPPPRRRQIEISPSGSTVQGQRSFYYPAPPHTRVIPIQNPGTTVVGPRPIQKIRFTNRPIYTVTPKIATVPRQQGVVTYVQSPVHPVTYQIVPRMQSYRPRPQSAQNSMISSTPQSQLVEHQGRVVDQTVHTVFANVADKYDLMNDAMSMGIHRLWKDYYVKRVNPQPNSKIIDVAGGTGDIAFRTLKKMQTDPQSTGDVTIFDINQNMLDVGQHRAQTDTSLILSKLSWVCGNAEQLPFEDNTFDLYTIAFGIRNCTNVDKVLSEAFRVLKPTGRFTCLEFSQINPMLKPVYDLYSFQVIPIMGQMLASDYNSYKYLVESIRMFPDQQAFARMIKDVGFTDVCYENLSLGICAIHTGTKKMICLGRFSITSVTRRSFCSSNIHFVRFRGSSTTPSEFVKVGRICNVKKEGLYEPGQLFLHKVFAYRGVVVCSFNVKVQGKPKANEAIGTSEIVPYYQVLVNRADWDYMNFRPDITSYFVESSVNREEKVLSVINGMDCVPHNEIVPFTSTEKDPIKHDLFPRLFERNEDSKDDSDVNYSIRRDLHPHFTLANQRSWLAPQAVYKETTENIQVTVVPYFLGPTFSNGAQKYFWRYVVRLESLDKRPVVVRERLIKIFSLNNLHQVGGPGVDGGNPRLTAQNPAFQFSSTVDLLQPKGGHMWGRFTMERDDGTTFEITMPTIALECHAEAAGEQTEQSRQ